MIRELRMRRGLEPDDTSQDHKLRAMTGRQALREFAAWYLGDRNWADEFLDRAETLGADLSPLDEPIGEQI
jgi:hypothetical protein